MPRLKLRRKRLGMRRRLLGRGRFRARRVHIRGRRLRGPRIGALLLKSSQRNPVPRRTIALMVWQGSEKRIFSANTTNNTGLSSTAATGQYGARVGIIRTGIPSWPVTTFPTTAEINQVFASAPVTTTTNPILFTVYPKIFKQFRVLSNRISIRFDRTWLDPTQLVIQTAFKYVPMYAYIVASVDPDAFDTQAEQAAFTSLQYIRQQRYHKIRKIDPEWMTTRSIRMSMNINPQKMLANSGNIYKSTNTMTTAGPYTALTSIIGETPQHVYVWWGVVTEDGTNFANGTSGTFATLTDIKLTEKILFMEPHTNSEIGAL